MSGFSGLSITIRAFFIKSLLEKNRKCQRHITWLKDAHIFKKHKSSDYGLTTKYLKKREGKRNRYSNIQNLLRFVHHGSHHWQQRPVVRDPVRLGIPDMGSRNMQLLLVQPFHSPPFVQPLQFLRARRRE
mmetsp:Transcript_23249/g.68761  ORF Transcript_23249/g.68761 Transcript_23249/m.68761 type:complete len:130 (-) Transcript_23249:2743-3132(-)